MKALLRNELLTSVANSALDKKIRARIIELANQAGGDAPKAKKSSKKADDGDEPKAKKSSKKADDGDEPKAKKSSKKADDGDEPKAKKSKKADSVE
jgi:hypothetical protein